MMVKEYKKRPKEVYRRKELGHCKAYTVESRKIDHKRKSKYCFITLTKRKSRYYIALLLPDRKEGHDDFSNYRNHKKFS